MSAPALCFHYYGENGHSLCGKWSVILAPHDTRFHVDTGVDDPEDCVACQRKVYKLREAAA